MASSGNISHHRASTDSRLFSPRRFEDDEKKKDRSLTDIFDQVSTFQPLVNGYWELPKQGAHRLAKRPYWNLTHCLITDKDLATLVDPSFTISQLTLHDCPNLTEFPQTFLNTLKLIQLNITTCLKITTAALKNLLKSPGVQSVEELRLNELNVENEHLSLLHPFKNLTTLYLQRNPALEPSSLAQLINQVKSLQNIHLEGCFVEYSSLQASFLEKNRALTIYTGTMGAPKKTCTGNISPPKNQPRIVNLSYLQGLSAIKETFPTEEDLKKSHPPQDVRVLDLSYADLTDVEFQTLLSRFPHIETLSLYYNPRLTVEVEPFFKNLLQLKKLYLGGLDLIPPETLARILESLPHLEELCLRRVSLENPSVTESILKLSKLKILNLCFCILPKNLTSSLQNMGALKTTLIGTNEAQGTKERITDTSTLISVSLPQVMQSLQTFIRCEHHKTPESDQSLETMIPAFNKRLEAAHKDWALFLGKDRLSPKEKIELETVFRICAKWEEKLKVNPSFWNDYAPSFNTLELFLFIQHEIKNLKELHLANLKLFFLPDFILKMSLPNISMINISGNFLETSLHLFKTQNFPSVSQLFIQNSHLKTIPWTILNELAIETWDLSHNDIQEIFLPAPVQYPALKTLNLSHNPLKPLSPNFWEFLSNFKNLRSIDLSSTPISNAQVPLEFQDKVVTDS